MSLLYCLLNSEVRAEIVRKWRSYKHKREQPKRGSAQSLPVGRNSVISGSRMYTGVCPGAESLSSASGVVIQEAFGPDVLSASKFLQDQRDDRNQELSLFQEVKLNGYDSDENLYLNTTQHNLAPNAVLLHEGTSNERNPPTMNDFSNCDTKDYTGN